MQSSAGLKPTLGIGSCLAGNSVRYNGQTKSPNQHVQAIGEHFAMRAFCPEMGIGLGVPRPPIHIVGDEQAVRVLDVDTHTNDFTEPLQGYARTVLELAPELCGYVLVKGSPSCGYDRVKRYAPNGHSVASDAQGIFAAALAKADPLMPLEDDGRLNDPGLRDSFVARAFTYHHWKQLASQGVTAAALVDFHSRHKYQVMAHDVGAYRELGRMVANVGGADIASVQQEFITLLMQALGKVATRRSHTNVLQHIAGYLKRSVSSDERQRLAELINQYRSGLVPLVVPITMLRHHFANQPNAYIDQQVFMAPYPDALQLRNVL
jgi:uncharacterized protein YbgA (DUF1722 family)/uncharacterized protein YbbK (DUF523 family)